MNLIKYQIIIIGTSAGGFKALHTLLPLFGKKFRLPIVVVQHRKPVDDSYLIQSWGKSSRLLVKDALEGMLPTKGKVYVAPANHHLIFNQDGSFGLISSPPVNYSRPSIDVTMKSAAEVFGDGVIGVILTGASRDGAEGMLKIRLAGGLTIAQKPEEAEIDLMPRSAMDLGAVDFVLTLSKIPDFLTNMLFDSRLISTQEFD